MIQSDKDHTLTAYYCKLKNTVTLQITIRIKQLFIILSYQDHTITYNNTIASQNVG